MDKWISEFRETECSDGKIIVETWINPDGSIYSNHVGLLYHGPLEERIIHV
jgi:hypothetical protein